MSINWPVALLWLQVLTAVGALIFVGAWILTGGKNTTLKVLAVAFILSTSLIGLYRTLLATHVGFRLPRIDVSDSRRPSRFAEMDDETARSFRSRPAAQEVGENVGFLNRFVA